MSSSDTPKYDGCSGNMSKLWRRLLKRPPPFEFCCHEHDQPYAIGGTEIQRFCADMRLYFCVLESGWPKTAHAMFILVRYGGAPWLPFSWRFGFETRLYRYKKDGEV